LKNSTFFPQRFRQNIFLFQIAKIRDKFQRNIYNFEFHRQLRKPVGGFLYRCTKSVFNRTDDQTRNDPPGLLSQIS